MTVPAPRLAAPPLPPSPDRLRELAADGAMSVADAVAFSGVSRSELFAAIGRGELASLKWGKKRLILRRALVEMLAAKIDG